MKYRIYHCCLETTTIVPDTLTLGEVKEIVLKDINRRLNEDPVTFVRDTGMVCTDVERG